MILTVCLSKVLGWVDLQREVVKLSDPQPLQPPVGDSLLGQLDWLSQVSPPSPRMAGPSCVGLLDEMPGMRHHLLCAQGGHPTLVSCQLAVNDFRKKEVTWPHSRLSLSLTETSLGVLQFEKTGQESPYGLR